jgi:hypothetical protein
MHIVLAARNYTGGIIEMAKKAIDLRKARLWRGLPTRAFTTAASTISSKFILADHN